MDTVRAKFTCNSVKLNSLRPQEVSRWTARDQDPVRALVWPRTFEFSAVSDSGTPEDQRYHTATPSGTIVMQVDNPAVAFEPGKSYLLTFEQADD